MKKIEYDLPIFEDEDLADLNEYSSKMANAIKVQMDKVEDAVDKFTEPLSYKGEISTIQDLPTTADNGDIYSIISENKNYIWNGTDWVEYSATIDLTNLEEKINNTKEEIENNIEQEINNTKEEIEKNVEEEINTIKEQILDYEIVDEW